VGHAARTRGGDQSAAESTAKDSARLTRFQQEARALSALNHPNLLAIFDVGAENGTNFIVSEYLEGQTLRERLEAGPMPCRKATEVARQVVIGMAAAHEKGIVHRDLKPDNIFLTRDDYAKILDFGLAKHALGGNGASGGTLTGLTMTGPTMGGPALTAPGSVMGTVGYMSPEQVCGQTVDYRSDIFSFGAILYEMVTGKRAFTGNSAIETMNAILKSDVEEIDPSKITASSGIAPIVRHCSEKNPADRFGERFGICTGGAVGNGNAAGDEREWRSCGDRCEECGQMGLGVESGGSAGGSVSGDGVVGVSQIGERRATGVCDCDAGRSESPGAFGQRPDFTGRKMGGVPVE
jgi:serine/threonine protein kinase